MEALAIKWSHCPLTGTPDGTSTYTYSKNSGGSQKHKKTPPYYLVYNGDTGASIARTKLAFRRTVSEHRRHSRMILNKRILPQQTSD